LRFAQSAGFAIVKAYTFARLAKDCSRLLMSRRARNVTMHARWPIAIIVLMLDRSRKRLRNLFSGAHERIPFMHPACTIMHRCGACLASVRIGCTFGT